MLSEDDLQRLKETNACPEGNLSEAVLVGTHLEGADLEGANLEGANLQKAHLEGANLSYVNLQRANLDGASLIYSKVNKTLFGGSRLCNTTMPDGRIEYSGCVYHPFFDKKKEELED